MMRTFDISAPSNLVIMTSILIFCLGGEERGGGVMLLLLFVGHREVHKKEEV